MKQQWTFFGPRLEKPRPSLSVCAVAVIFAAQTFVPGEGEYPLYMAFLAWISAAWITWFGIKKRALLAFFAAPISLLWLNPMFSGNWFDSVGLEYLLCHSALALVWAVCGYTFLATEKA